MVLPKLKSALVASWRGGGLLVVARGSDRLVAARDAGGVGDWIWGGVTGWHGIGDVDAAGLLTVEVSKIAREVVDSISGVRDKR